ncbi:MAG: amidohydrolase, partial [Myxococcales bacterium]
MHLHTDLIFALNGVTENILVEGERVVARGIDVSAPADVPRTDHGGRRIIPAFVDNHCHILPTGLDLLKLHLGPASTKEEVLDLVRDRHRETPEGWLHAVHYDQNRYGAHLTRHDLDAISDARPILLRHVNGHASVANTAALRAAGVDRDTPDPTGGEYLRDADGTPNGVLLEDAHDHVSNAAPGPNLEEMVEAILRAGASMRALGIDCATDMMTGRFDLPMELEAYRIAAERGCEIDLRLCLQWRPTLGPRAIPRETLESYLRSQNPKIIGVKLFADGAFGSATAAIYGEYSGAEPVGKPYTSRATPTGKPGTSGQLIYRPEKLTEMVQIAADAGFPVAIHAIGDYAVDLVLDAFEATPNPAMHRLEHAMILSDAQIERIARVGCPVTMQPEFLIKLGHVYRRQLGDERTYRLKRARSLLDAGIPLSFSSDRPIVAGDPRDGIRAAVNR